MATSPPSSNFVHLHCHTHYSLLDGCNRIGELVNRAKELGQPAVAITDHGNMFGAIEFYEAANKAGIKPIIGLEAYIAPGDRQLREAIDGETSYHLLLLAQNMQGYRNLLKLTSTAFRDGFYYKPRIDREVLEEFNEGLICTSTCLGAEIPQALIKKNRALAEEHSDWYLKVFGTDRFYMELQDHGIEDQRAINPELIEIANRKGIGLIVTNDVHYLKKDDAEPHDVLLCVSTRALVSDENRMRFETDEFYLKSNEEMASLFPSIPEALSNTVEIADKCNLELDFNKRYTPVYHAPDEKTPEDYLRELVYQGAEERYDEVTDELRERIDFELEVIQSKGFSSYFLIVWDFVQDARRNNIPCGARGSGCSSVVAHCLYLSQPDPMHYGLYFERFMDPDRDEMPDIDIDICQDSREKTIQYVREKYGHVAQIITFGTLKARAAIRDVCRVLDVPLAEADRVAKMVPEELKMTLDKALDREPDLKRLYDTDERIKKVIDVGRRIEGFARNTSIHAAGVVVAEQPLDDLLPLYQPPGSGVMVTQYDGPTVEQVGLLKMDFLGLKTLSVLALTVKLVEENYGIKINVEDLDLTDQKVYRLFAAGETKGVFQFESGGMRGVLMKMRPNRIEDLIAANALYRPGPMVNIDPYVERKHGGSWTTPHAIMSEVLAETYGIIVYQEQVARLVNQLGGVERKRAFRLAKAISKKKIDKIEAEREPFISGAVEKGVARKTATEIFDQIIPFGEYAFNKAHSTGYALVAFQTAFLKAYYPLEFMAALLTYDKGDTDKVSDYMEECKRLQIEVRPPDVNSSGVDFTPVPGKGDKPGFIRFGLAAIKGVGQKAMEAIVREREANGDFEDLFDFCERVDLSAVNRGACEALIKAGAFDTTGAMRKALVEALDGALKSGASSQKDKSAGQMTMFGDFGGGGDDADNTQRIGNEEWTEAEMLTNEKAVLGFYVTKHPLASHEQTLRQFATADCRDLQHYGEGAKVVLGGMISRIRMVTTKSGRNAGSKLAVLSFEDLSGGLEAIVFSEQLRKYQNLIAPDQIVFLQGEVDRKREEPALRVSEVIPFEEGPARLADALILRVNGGHLMPERLAEIESICREHPGEQSFMLNLQIPQKMSVWMRCDNRLRVQPDAAFRNRIEGLLGEGSVSLVGKRMRN